MTPYGVIGWERVDGHLQLNPVPRCLRYGFNSHGHDAVRERLKDWRGGEGEGGRYLGVNLGKNKDSRDAAEDYVLGVKALGTFADYIVINVSSPNTPGLREMQGRSQLADLMDKVCATVGWLSSCS